MTHKSLLRIGAAAVAMISAAQAGEAEDLAALKQEIANLRSEYDAKIEALEARLKAAEENQAAPAIEIASAPTPAAAANPTPARTPVSQNAYNPAISVVLNGGYNAASRDAENRSIPGFPLDGEAGAPERGFTLGESELALDANIDHRVHGTLIFAIDDSGEVSVEEAFIQTTSLPGGFTLKGGKFFSGIGYLNENHAHNWDFIDAPLPYRAFLANQLGDAGLQLRWIAPTDFYLEAGAEILRGDNFPAGGAANKGAGAYAGFVQTGGDLGASSSWLAKLSYLRAKSDNRDVNGDIFTGRDTLGIVSLVYKWAPNGNPTVNNLIVNGEYFFGNERGDFNLVPVDIDRSGFYAQAVYQFRKGWRGGLRYARLMSNPAPAGVISTALDDLGQSPDAISALLEFDTSEFSRFRLMYTRDNSDASSADEFLARYTVIFGPHGAHRF